MKTRAITFFVLLGMAVLGVIDYCHSLTVRNIWVERIERDAQRPDYRNVIYSVEADFQRYPWVSRGMAEFLARRPVACFVTATGEELNNDISQTACRTDERTASTKTGRVEFAMPLGIAAPPGPFLMALRKNRGVWVGFKMQAMFLPLTVEAKPVFLDMGAFCQEKPDDCAGVLSAISK